MAQKSAAYRLADRIGEESIAAQALRKQTKENQDRLERLGASSPAADYDPEEAQDEVEQRRADLIVLLDTDDTAQRVQSDLEKNKKIIEKQLNLVNDPETSYSEVENLKAVIQAKRIACREFLHDTRHDASEEENTRFANAPFTVERVEVSANEAELDRLRAQARTNQAKIAQLEDTLGLGAEKGSLGALNQRLRAEYECLRQQMSQETPKHDIRNTPETRAVIAWAKSRLADENQNEAVAATNPGSILYMALRTRPFDLSQDVETSNPAV